MSSRDKENSGLDWRDEPLPEKKEFARSHGLNPKAFHSSKTDRSGKDAVQQMHHEAQQRLIEKEKRNISQQTELKRSAYKQVTSLRTYPIQSQALARFRELSDQYLSQPVDDESDQETPHPDDQSQAISSVALSSSAASSSGRSAELEPKRILRAVGKSPAQGRRKAELREEFLKEQSLVGPVHDCSQFANPLWSMEPRIFSVEKSAEGKRKYCVGQLGRFLDKYWRKNDPSHRHFYELIREKTPCRLYLDIEFSKESNNIDFAEELLEEFLLELSTELTEKFGVGRIDRTHVVDLDSSTRKKFSRHWIVHLPDGSLFPHTAAMGHFVREFIGRLSNEQATSQLKDKGRLLLQKYLFVKVSPSNADSDKSVCVVDMGVYTRNRLFRLLGSSKFGKDPSAALRIADTNRFPFPSGFSNDSFYVPALQRRLKQQSQLQEGNDSDGSESVEAAIQEFVAATDWSDHATALAETLVVPVNAPKLAFPILPFDENLLKPIATSTNRRGSGPTAPLAYGQSPYPILDGFVVDKLGSRGDIRGSIRAWNIDYSLEGAPLRVTYQMSRNRWCERIQRHHKSNNIMWTVDLNAWNCVQTCHDPDCRALKFVGTPVEVPEHIREQVADAIFEEQLAKLDVNELIAPVSQTVPATQEAPKAPSKPVEHVFATLTLDEQPCSKQERSSNASAVQVSQLPSNTETENSRRVSSTPCNSGFSEETNAGDQENHGNSPLANQTDDLHDEFGLLAFLKNHVKEKKESKASAANQPVSSKATKGSTGSTELSDDALLDAVLSHPDLFP